MLVVWYHTQTVEKNMGGQSAGRGVGRVAETCSYHQSFPASVAIWYLLALQKTNPGVIPLEKI